MSLPGRAMRQLDDVGEVRRALAERRVMHLKDDEIEAANSALYEELRLLTNEQLRVRAHNSDTRNRAVLIADIMEYELP